MEIPLTDNARPLIVYFDNVPTYGILNGAIQIELTATVLRPNGTGGVASVPTDAGHIRCSPSAAVELLTAIQAALNMLQDQQKTAPSPIN